MEELYNIDKKPIKLFLDDYRVPMDCVSYMHSRIGKENPIYLEKDWIIVKNFREFVDYITKEGVPDLISFDHDLADGHYHKNFQEGELNYNSNDFDNENNKTGYHCAKELVNYCEYHNVDLPKFYVHSMNPVGTENITNYLESYKKYKDANK